MATVSVNGCGIQELRGHAVVKTDRQCSRTQGLAEASGARATRGGFAPLPPNTISGHQLSPLYDLVDRTLQAEVDQARLFDGMLRAEIAQLEQAVKVMEIRGIRRAAGRIDANTPPAELLELRARIAELHRLRAALWRRFLRPSHSDDSGDALKS